MRDDLPDRARLRRELRLAVRRGLATPRLAVHARDYEELLGLTCVQHRAGSPDAYRCAFVLRDVLSELVGRLPDDDRLHAKQLFALESDSPAMLSDRED